MLSPQELETLDYYINKGRKHGVSIQLASDKDQVPDLQEAAWDDARKAALQRGNYIISVTTKTDEPKSRIPV